MIDYIAELYVRLLIILSCLAWTVPLFWGCIYLAEKLCRWVYQDEPKQLYTSEPEPEPNAECEDCGTLILVNELDETCPRCDLCDAIWHAEVDRYGFSRADRALHRELNDGP
jgi:hypothetical protein